MRNIISIVLLALVTQFMWAQSGNNYDPVNPGDPEVYFTVKVQAEPSRYGSVSPSGTSRYSAGSTVSCSATAYNGYKFLKWMVGDSVVSELSNCTYTVPEKSSVLIAYFDLDKEGYDPGTPGDPLTDGYQHKLAVYANPSIGGSFNSALQRVTEGNTVWLYAYPNSGFRFVSWKQDGKIVSTSNPLTITMGEKDLSYTAQFTFDPSSPSNPVANNFNSATGELVIDDFTTNSIYSAISNVLSREKSSYSDVKKFVIAGKLDSNDFGYARNMSNCSVIDVSRTEGYTFIPDWSFSSMSALTTVILPSCVDSIGTYAFYGCNNLTEVKCYALTPPGLTQNVFSTDSSMIVRVPSSAISLYKSKEYWKKYTILPLDEETGSINTTLPDNISSYSNLKLVLENIQSGKTVMQLIAKGKTGSENKYSFANLILDSKYNLYIRTSSNKTLASISGIVPEKEGKTVTFSSVSLPQNLTLTVVTPEGSNVTDNVSITWYDEDNKYLGSDNTVKDQLEGDMVSYQVKFTSTQLGLLYKLPEKENYTVKSSDNQITYYLEKIPEVKMSGTVTDKTRHKSLSNASVTVSQLVNGTYNKSQTVTTGKDGMYSLTVTEDTAVVTVSATNYVTITDTVKPGTSQSYDVSLVKAKGTTIFSNLFFAPNVTDGAQEKTQEGYDDQANVTCSIYNETQQKEIKDFSQQDQTYILVDKLNDGDKLKITAKSKADAFNDITESVTVKDNSAKVQFTIHEHGDIRIKVNTSNKDKSYIGMLYDSDGKMLKKQVIKGDSLSIPSLADGTYTVIAMIASSHFNSLAFLADLTKVGLVEGRDFIKKEVTVKSGRISEGVIDDIPVLDEESLSYTGANTEFNVSKSSATVGDYVTLKGKVDFKSQYTGVKDVKLIFDIPSGCSFVDNSLIIGDEPVAYAATDSRITVSLQDSSKQVRFCIVPTKGGDFKPCAYAEFTISGNTITQPIGSAFFSVQSLSLNVAEKTSATSVYVNGVAPSTSAVKIYDNGTFVGQTTSYANGNWEAMIDLVQPYTKSYHSIYAEVNDGTNILQTETKTIEYDATLTSPSKITMVYNGTSVVFDQTKKTNSKKYYIYIPGKTEFTFIGEFTNKDTALVKNVNFIVLASDGSTRTLPASYNAKKGSWFTCSSYADAAKIPVNVKMSYMGVTGTFSDEGSFDEQADAMALMGQEIQDFYSGDTLTVEKVVTTEKTATMDFKLKNSTKDIKYSLEVLDYDDAISYLKTQSYEYGKSADGKKVCYSTELTNDGITVTTAMVDSAFAVRVRMYVPESGSTAKGAALKTLISTLKASFSNGKFVESLGTIGGHITDLVGIKSYIDVNRNFSFMCDYINTIVDKDIEWRNVITTDLTKKCPDGKSKIPDGKIDSYTADNEQLKSSADDFENNCYKYLEEYQKRIRNHVIYDIAMLGAGKVIGILGKSGKLINSSLTTWANRFMSTATTKETTAAILTNGLGGTLNLLSGIANPKFCDFESTYQKFCDFATSGEKNMMGKYAALHSKIKASYKACNNKEEDQDDDDDDNKKNKQDYNNPNLTPSIDPSGFVYEAVFSNRVEGVTATCYKREKVEDPVSHDLIEKVQKWDAAEYGQENPLITDKDGFYQWFVPSGEWMVSYEKEGYDSVHSAWLPVPPPQLDVNVNISRNTAPNVGNSNVYADSLEIVFDQYMNPSTLTAENIIVKQNNVDVAGTVKIVDATVAYKDENVKYATKVRFIPASPFAKGSLVHLQISHKVESHAGIQMNQDFGQDFAIEKEVTFEWADSSITIPYNSSRAFTVKVNNAKSGQKVLAATSSDVIVSLTGTELTLDDDGHAVFYLNGDMPGLANVTFSLDGYNATAKVNATVATSTVNVPQASIESGKAVTAGTNVGFTSEDASYKIWYTTDGTCPCDENGTRKLYSDPITIDNAVTIKVMAENISGVVSEVADFTYTIAKAPTAIEEAPAATLFGGITSIYDLQGKRMGTTHLGELPPGIYVIHSMVNNTIFVKKFVKR